MQLTGLYDLIETNHDNLKTDITDLSNLFRANYHQLKTDINDLKEQVVEYQN